MGNAGGQRKRVSPPEKAGGLESPRPVLRPCRQAPAIHALPPGLITSVLPGRQAQPADGNGSGRGSKQRPLGGQTRGRTSITENILGKTSRRGRREVARLAKLPFVTARRLWHALGIPEVGNSQLPFAQADLDAMPEVAELRKLLAMDDELVLALARAISRSTDRLAAWQTGLVADAVAASREGGHAERSIWSEGLDAEERSDVIEQVLELADALEPILVYSWRRHLTAALAQFADTEDDPTEAQTGNVRTIGFADLVGFTSTVDGMSDHKLSTMVGDFEGLASDVVTIHGGRIVKTLGDEVLFLCENPAAAGAIGLDLIEALGDIPDMPSLRVGISTGSVVRQFGDVFGTTVNRASRLTDAAMPGTVVVDTPTQARLTNVSGFELLSLEEVPLQGLGNTELWELRRASRPSRRGPTAYYPPGA